MESKKWLRELFKDFPIKQIAKPMGVSESKLYKWTEQGGSHRRNPLEWFAALMRCTDARRLAEWVCEQAGGTFLPNAKPRKSSPKLLCAENVMSAEVLKFQEVVAAVAQKGGITKAEAALIRSQLARTNAVTEGFVQACERGVFRLGVLLCPFGWWLVTGEIPEPLPVLV